MSLVSLSPVIPWLVRDGTGIQIQQFVSMVCVLIRWNALLVAEKKKDVKDIFAHVT